MSTRVNDELSPRLFWQAGVTVVFAPFAATGGKGWVLLVLLLAAAAGGLGALLRELEASGRNLVLGFEGVALLLGALAAYEGHYIPGTIVGGVTLFTALTTPAVDPEPVHPLSALIPVHAGTQRVTYAPVTAVAAPSFAGAFPAVATAAPAGYAGASLVAAATTVAAPVAAATVSAIPERWAPDPTGRHHYRWWVGRAWTAHVSSNGTNGVDPV